MGRLRQLGRSPSRELRMCDLTLSRPKDPDNARNTSLAGLARAFSTNRAGNIAILFVFIFSVLVLFIGGAVDYTRYNAVRSDLMESMDSAGLAMAQLAAIDDTLTDAELKDYGRKFFHENFQHESVVDGLVVDFNINSATITPQVSGRIKTLFLGVGMDLLAQLTDNASMASDLEFLDLTTDTEITRRGSGKIELALVLDVTGSMRGSAGGEKKIVSLRNAVDKLLQVFYDTRTTDPNIKVGVVPFNAQVNPGGSAGWTATWGDENAEAVYHGAHFFHVDENGLVDVNTKVNHYRLFDSVPGAEWNGCVEARPYPLDELDEPPGQSTPAATLTGALVTPTAAEQPDARIRLAFDRAPGLALAASTVGAIENSRWVPYFREDEPDCWRRASYCRGSWSDSESYVQGGATIWVTDEFGNNIKGYWFDDPGEDGQNRNSYDNRWFINDQQYSYRDMGEPYARYAKIVADFRYVTNHSFAELSDYWDGVKTRFADLGAVSKGLDEYVIRNAYAGWWDPATNTYKNKYNLTASIDESISDSDSSMRGPNDDCAAPILPLTDDRTKVEARMAMLYPNGYTNSANGMIWGWRVLSPGAPFTEGVPYTDTDWVKAVVLMTDGQNTVGSRNTHKESRFTAYGYAVESRMGAGMTDPDDMRDQYDEKLLRICHRMKEQGILVYSIVFGLDNANLEQVFRSCATQPAAPYYYKAPSGADLESTFGNIAQDLVELHVSR